MSGKGPAWGKCQECHRYSWTLKGWICEPCRRKRADAVAEAIRLTADLAARLKRARSGAGEGLG